MAVGAGYLAKIMRAVRVKTATTAVTAELTDLIEECRADLISMGVAEFRVRDESDPLILGAVRCFVRWKVAMTEQDVMGNREDYEKIRDELRRKGDYKEATYSADA